MKNYVKREHVTISMSMTYFTINNLALEKDTICTTDAILHFVDDVVTGLDRRLYTVTIFLDFSKAFDTVNKTIMLQKLDRYGFRNYMNNFLNSYLSDRKMYVSVNGSDSTV